MQTINENKMSPILTIFIGCTEASGLASPIHGRERVMESRWWSARTPSVWVFKKEL